MLLWDWEIRVDDSFRAVAELGYDKERRCAFGSAPAYGSEEGIVD
jgi:hypothetical protein